MTRKKASANRARPYSQIWLQRSPHGHPTRGVAEIYVDGGLLSYHEHTCIGRIFQKHLSKTEISAIINAIEKALLEHQEKIAAADKKNQAEK